MAAPALVPAELPGASIGAELSCLDTCATTPGKIPGPRGGREPNAVLAGYIRDQGPHLGRWAYHKANADRLARKLEAPGASLLERAARMRACGELLLYRDDGSFLGPDMRCGQRLCPMCQAYRAGTWGRRLDDAAGKLAELPGVWVLLTLTMRNVSLSETRRAIRKLHRAVDRLAKRREWAARGWIRQTEVTVNVSSSTSHPHCHLLLYLPADYYRTPARVIPARGRGRPRIEPGYMTQARIRELWADALGVEYDPVVDIRAVRMDDPAERAGVLREVAKYGVKPAELAGLDPADLATLISELASHRTFSVCGELRRHIPPRRLEWRRQLERMIRLQKAPGPQEPPLYWAEIGKWDPERRRFDLVPSGAGTDQAVTPGRNYWVTRSLDFALQPLAPLAPPEWIGDVYGEPENLALDDRQERRRLAALQARRPDLYRKRRE
jgi:plasmid rolling circle replication initiator protein Rep